MKRLTVLLAGLVLAAPFGFSAITSAKAEQIGKSPSELVEMELLTSSELVEKQKAGF